MADLRVALELDDSQYTAKLAQAGIRAQDFGEKAERAAANAGGAFSRFGAGIDGLNTKLSGLATAIIGIGIVDFVRSVLSAADAADEMAGRFGFAVQSMLEISRSAEQAGLGTDGLNTILTKFVTNAEEAVGGNKKLQTAFERLGVSMGELRNLSPEESFAKLIEAIADSPNKTQALAAAMDILGKKAATIDFGDLNDQMKENNGQMAEEAAAAAAAGETMRQLGVFVADVRNEFLKLLSPLLQLIGDESSGFRGAEFAAKGLMIVLAGAAISTTLAAFNGLVGVLRSVATWLGIAAGAVLGLGKTTTAAAEGFDRIQKEASEAASAIAAYGLAMKASGSGPLMDEDFLKKLAGGKALDDLGDAAGRATGKMGALGAAMRGAGAEAAGMRIGTVVADLTGFSGIVAVLRGALSMLAPLLGVVGAAFTSVGAIVAAVAAVVGAFVGFILYAFPEARAAIGGWVSAVVDGFKWLGGVISNFISSSLDWLIAKWDAAANAARRALGYQEIDFAGNREAARGRAALDRLMEKPLSTVIDEWNRDRAAQGLPGTGQGQPRGFQGVPSGGGGGGNAAADAAKRAAEEARRKADAEAEATAQLRNQLTTENAAFNRSVERLRLEQQLVGVGESERNRRLEFFDAETQYNEQRAKILEDIRRLEQEQSEEGAADRSQRIAALNDQLRVIEERKNTVAEERTELAAINRAEELRLAIMEQQRSMQQNIQALQDEYADLTATDNERRIRDAERAFRAQEEAMVSFFRKDNPTLSDAEIKNLPAYIAAIDQMKEKQAEFVAQTRQNIDASREFSTGWEKAMRQYAEDVSNKANQANTLFTTFAQGWEDAFVKFAETGKLSFKDLVNTILIELVKIQAQKMFVTLFGQGGILGSIGGLLGFAEGGEPPVGRPSIVGEKGPELFIPSVPGTIVPNKDLGRALDGGQQVVHNTYITNNISAVDAKSVAQLFAENRRLLLGNVEQARKELPSSAPMR